jgi:hypothetical protein
MLPPVIGTTMMVIGAQNMLGGFLLAVITENSSALSIPEPGPANSGNQRAQEDMPGEPAYGRKIAGS